MSCVEHTKRSFAKTGSGAVYVSIRLAYSVFAPVKILPIDLKSMPSSQLNTRHCRPRACASAFTLSVLPVPAGQNGLVSQRFLLIAASLSWQKDRVYVKLAQKRSPNRARFVRYLRGRTGCHRSLGAYPAKNATLFEFSLCLSRACLGKPMTFTFYIKIGQKWRVFRTCVRVR